MTACHAAIPQVLGEQHAPLYELLGRTSGRDVDKLAALAARGVPVSRRPGDGIPLLVRRGAGRRRGAGGGGGEVGCGQAEPSRGHPGTQVPEPRCV